MERYFQVTEESSLYGEWFNYKDNRKAVNDLFNSFSTEYGIESREYYASTDAIYIVPTEKDSVKFVPYLCSPQSNGLWKFKASSKMGKSWVQTLKDKGLMVYGKPTPIFHFEFNGGRFRSRIFDQNGKVYCSLDPAEGEVPTGFVEMKASEFYKIIENSDKVAS